MTTKDQERAALVKIKKIVADLGDESYLGTAFDGAFELAEQNIDMDAAFNTKYYIDRANDLEGSHYEEKVQLETELRNCRIDHERLQKRGEYLQGKVDEFKSALGLLGERNVELGYRIDGLIADIARRDTEIVHLKASLYDLTISNNSNFVDRIAGELATHLDSTARPEEVCTRYGTCSKSQESFPSRQGSGD